MIDSNFFFCEDLTLNWIVFRNKSIFRTRNVNFNCMFISSLARRWDLTTGRNFIRSYIEFDLSFEINRSLGHKIRSLRKLELQVGRNWHEILTWLDKHKENHITNIWCVLLVSTIFNITYCRHVYKWYVIEPRVPTCLELSSSGQKSK
jgi:hypothetical protein